MPKFIECTPQTDLSEYAHWTLVNGYTKSVTKEGHTYSLIKKERLLGCGDRILNILLGVLKSLFRCFTNINSKEIQYLLHAKKETVRLGLKVEKTPRNLNFYISDEVLKILKKTNINKDPRSEGVSKTEFPFEQIESIPLLHFTNQLHIYQAHVEVDKFITEKNLSVEVAPTRLLSYLTHDGRSVEYIAQIRAERSNNQRIENMPELIEIAKAGFQFTPFNSVENYLVIENVSKASAETALRKLLNYAEEDQIPLFEELISKRDINSRIKQIEEQKKIAEFHKEKKIITGKEPVANFLYFFDEHMQHYNTLTEAVDFVIKHLNKAFNDSKETDPALIRNIRMDFGDIPQDYKNLIDPDMKEGLESSTEKEYYSATFIGKALQHLVDQKVIHSWTHQRSALYVQA